MSGCYCGGAGWTWGTDLYGEAVKEPCFNCDAFDKRVEAQAPILPYAGTSGHGSNGASKDRAIREDADGTTTLRQGVTLSFLRQKAEWGATWKELGEAMGWHAGQSSGVLSVLHKERVIVRLKNRRDRCSVYVMPEYVHGRETSPHGSHVPKLCDNCKAHLKSEEAS